MRGSRTLINSLVLRKGKSTGHIFTIGIDLAKKVFAMNGVNATDHNACLMAPEFVLSTARAWKTCLTRP